MIYQQESYEIIGACIEVQQQLGIGFSEPVYQEALAIELRDRNIPFVREKELEIFYKGHLLDKTYKADFVCYDNIILELKAVSELSGEHRAQVLNYLKATHHKLGLLVNFGVAPLQRERLINGFE